MSSAGDARRQAAHILDGDRFRSKGVPMPFRGVLDTVGRWFHDVVSPAWHWTSIEIVDPFDRLYHAIEDFFARILRVFSPSGALGGLGPVLLVILLVAIGALLAFGIMKFARRRTRDTTEESGPDGEDERIPSSSLLAEADTAERQGDLGRALRLRFVAGLVTLHEGGILADPLSPTDGRLRVILPSMSFDLLATTHEEVAYGERPATTEDLGESRERWPRVPTELAAR